MVTLVAGIEAYRSVFLIRASTVNAQNCDPLGAMSNICTAKRLVIRGLIAPAMSSPDGSAWSAEVLMQYFFGRQLLGVGHDGSNRRTTATPYAIS